MQHPCLTPLPMSTLSLEAQFYLIMSRRSLQLTSIFLSFSGSLLQLSFCQSMKHKHISFLMPSTLSDIIRINPIASLVPLPFRNTNYSSSITSAILFSIISPSFPICIVKMYNHICVIEIYNPILL